MDRVAELTRREHALRDKVRRAPAGEFGSTQAERKWIMRELREMRVILDRHLATIATSERPLEEYRLEFALPMYQYLSRSYTVFFPELVEDLR